MGKELTGKQKRFIIEYLQCWNATEAARRAGYSKTNGSLAVTGHRTLRNAKVKEAIRVHLAEKAMSAEEVLMRLGEQARADMADFMSIGDERGRLRLDLRQAKEKGLLHLVKKVRQSVQGTSVELHDAQAALVHIGRHHGLFVDVQENRMDRRQWRDVISEIGGVARGKLADVGPEEEAV